jgi:hypothetical protein
MPLPTITTSYESDGEGWGLCEDCSDEAAAAFVVVVVVAEEKDPLLPFGGNASQQKDDIDIKIANRIRQRKQLIALFPPSKYTS